MNIDIKTDKIGHTLRVFCNGVNVGEFDEISDDYAYTHQSDLVRLLKDNAQKASSIEELKNIAWSKL